MKDQFHFLLMQTFHLTNRKMHLETSKMGLDPGQPKILQILKGTAGLTPKEIAARCKMDKSTVTLLIQRMEADDLLEKARSKQDRRSVLITLTKKGNELAGHVNTAGTTVDRQALKGFSEKEIGLNDIFCLPLDLQ